ncbi:MAG: alpha/beta hydrolase [Phenylobacterium sp.]|nr:MAG: alpha/beta hydrolase [Phenylobacterium sp.]
MRAEQPSAQGHVVRDGVRVAYEVFGTSGPVVVLPPCWIIVHARCWKAQVADLAQDCRVVVIDGRGNGASDRPSGPEAYSYRAFADDTLAVIDRLGFNEYALVGFSKGGPIAALIAQQRPAQVKAVALIAPVGPGGPAARQAQEAAFLAPLARPEGWAKYNAGYIRADYAGFARFFFERMFPERHSSKQVEDAVGWALETTAEVLVDSVLGGLRDETDLRAAYGAIACPILLVHGDADEVVPIETGRKVAALCGATVVEMAGSGHGPHLRHPAAVNGAIRRLLAQAGLLAPPRPPRRRRGGAPRALYLSSPIGLGHARRDLAIARALKRLKPGMEIDWLAQDPVTRVLASGGERLHPASARLASESRHIEDEAGEHDLNVFQALRRMDEILVRNFRVFQDVVEADPYDLVIADEGWEVDHFWHEHPGLKRAPLVWMTDFVGFAALPEGGRSEAALSADYNDEMVGHVEQSPGVRDRAIFVGAPHDVVDDRLGPDLPGRRSWVEARFAFSGYVLGDDVPRPEDKAALRDRLGLRQDETVCVVTVGGSGVGAPLIRRILAALPLAQRRRPGLRTIVVTGPRLPAEAFPPMAGVEVRGFEPELPALLAACDLALVQGGLSTCMELAAVRTPFLYFPLQRHFEQTVHVAHRLASYGAGRRLLYADADPEAIAAAMDEALGAPPAWRAVERDGAARAAGLIAELL